MRLSPKFVSSKLHIHNWVALLLMVLLTLIAHPSHAQSFQMVPDRAESVTRPALTSDDFSPVKPRRAGVSPVPFSISIDPVSQERTPAAITTVPPPGTPYKIGFGRDVPQLGSATDTAAYLQWQYTPQAGRIAAISISSPQAVGIRLGILVRRLPSEATLRFYAQGAETAYEISGKEIMDSIKRNLDAGDDGDATLTYWSPHIEGEEATLEIELPPGISPDTVEISIPRVSHFFLPPLAAQGGQIIQSMGDAASCEIDATCYSDWSPESNATAKMSYVDTDGGSYTCTGTLLNDRTSSWTPYFLSANHCISKQTVASTLTTYWFYRSASCNSGTLNPGTRTLTGGATLLYPSSVTDTSFMKLNNAPPAGVSYSGWWTAPALGTPVTGVHHPLGDLQKISFGSIQSFQDCTINPISGYITCNASTQTNAEYLDITFTSGITEGGSSGSGLFKKSGGSHYLIGQLFGGAATCSNRNGAVKYGRFDVAYNAALHQWLDAGTLGVALDNTSLVWTTGGNAPFTAQTTTSYFGGSAAQTGIIGNNQSTYLSTSVTGPGTLSFYWNVSSERDHDIFSVYLDGVRKLTWSGISTWYRSELTIPAGTHTVRWEYVKDSALSSGQDAGWVDDVVFTSASAYFDTVQKIFIGYYQRPADPAGLIYWADRLYRSGGNPTDIIEAFANSAESQALYGTINSSTISTVVNDIYNALFGRDAEIGGRNYYVNGFNSGQFTPATIMLNVLNGAQNEDLQSVNNKLTAANLFTRTIDPELDGSNFRVTYAGAGDVIAARGFLDSVTWNPVTIAIQAQTTAYIKANIADPGDAIFE